MICTTSTYTASRTELCMYRYLILAVMYKIFVKARSIYIGPGLRPQVIHNHHQFIGNTSRGNKYTLNFPKLQIDLDLIRNIHHVSKSKSTPIII